MRTLLGRGQIVEMDAHERHMMASVNESGPEGSDLGTSAHAAQATSATFTLVLAEKARLALQAAFSNRAEVRSPPLKGFGC